MTESTPVSLNFQSPNISTVVYAVQNDRSARHIVAQLFDGSATWTPPTGATPVIRYVKPDGTGGFYDADDNDDPAIVISGSKADMTIVEQALTVPGDVYMQLHFYAADGTRLTSFAWILRVQQSVLNDATIVSSDYFNVLTAKVAQAVQAASAAAESAAEAAASAALISIPLPITSGGTGATTAAGARENIGLGNVANERQYSAQNPPPYPVTSVNGETGAVTTPKNESGSNYCKMPDGTLIQWGQIAVNNVPITNAWGAIYDSPIQNSGVVFPITFVETPCVVASAKVSPTAWLENIGSDATGLGSYYLVRATATNASSGYISWMAIGRWK